MRTYLEMLKHVESLHEASETHSVMTRAELDLKNKLIEILNNKDGKYGPYRHPAYARRLKDFTLEIVPLDEDPEFTAAISFETGVVYMSEGFVEMLSTSKDTDEFGYAEADEDGYVYRAELQLSVLIRHELAHNLLMHQVRMMYKLNKSMDTPWEHAMYSSSYHSLLNIIEDFEISNRKYTSDDKKLVVRLKMFSRVIHGLVTEEHRSWDKLTVEEMYDKLVEEIEKVSAGLSDLIAGKISDEAKYTADKAKKKDFLTGEIIRTKNMYAMDDSPSLIRCPLDVFPTKKKYNSMPDTLKAVFDNMVKEYGKYDVNGETPEADKLTKVAETIANSSLGKSIKLTDDITLYTPEEKYLAQQVLKYLLGQIKKPTKTTIHVKKAEEKSEEYVKMYNDTVAEVDDMEKYPTADLYAALDKLEMPLPEIDM